MRATKCSRGIEEPANNVSHVYKYSTNVIIMACFFYCREKDPTLLCTIHMIGNCWTLNILRC